MKNIYKALSDFQNEVPVIHQATQGYGYTYADLKSIFEIIKPLLKEHGLGFTQLLDGENLKTIIFHMDSGEQLESSVHIQQNVSLAKMNAFQVLGSAITYYRRYSLSAALGLITDVDNDAATPKQTTKKEIDRRPALSENNYTKAELGTKEQIANVLKGYRMAPDKRKALELLYKNFA